METPNGKSRCVLPAGWASYFDADRGREYYYHSATRQTTWKHPGMHYSSPNSNDSKFTWKRKFSPEHNRYYYYNRGTGESQWRDPNRDYAGSSPTSTLISSSTQSKPTPRQRLLEFDEVDEHELALRNRLKRGDQVLAEAKLAMEELNKTKLALERDRQALERRAREEAEDSRVWLFAMLFALLQILALFKF